MARKRVGVKKRAKAKKTAYPRTTAKVPLPIVTRNNEAGRGKKVARRFGRVE